VVRRMGYLKRKSIEGQAKDIETIIRLRPWIEEESRRIYGNFRKTELITDYNAKADIFKFKLIFHQ